MADRIQNVTIIGGGTAGWITALMIQQAVARHAPTDQPMTVTLIESPNIPTVGVGEATVPGMPLFLRRCGISEREFFKICNASFKLGVQFNNWNVDKQGEFISYTSPFANVGEFGPAAPTEYFLEYGAGDLSFTQTFAVQEDLIRMKKGPRPLHDKEYNNRVGFAYHLDAGRFAGFLKEMSVQRGVVHLLDDVVSVEQDERGYVRALELERTGRHPLDLVIDCTGFRGLIINKTLGEPFVDYSEYLANDRAVAVQIPHKDPTKIDSVTKSTALSAGWVWRVPLFNRIGTGYVYSSAHKSDDEATQELLDHLGDEMGDFTPRTIPIRVGRSRNLWVKNCIAIGLSGGFIEPLESTAIHMIEQGAQWLCLNFPDKDFAPVLRENYNKRCGQLYDEVREFICLHYALNNRSDSQYWIDARHLKRPDSLEHNLELWRHRFPERHDLEFQSLFTSAIYHSVLLGKQVYQTEYKAENFATHARLNPDWWSNYLQSTRSKINQVAQNCADHHILLRELRGELQSLDDVTLTGFGKKRSKAKAKPQKLDLSDADVGLL